MKTSKFEVKRFVVKWNNFRYENYGRLPNVLKTRPLRKDDDEKIYRIYQCTQVTLDYTDICELKTREGRKSKYDNFYISDDTLIGYIREQLNDQEIGFFDLTFTVQHLAYSKCEEIYTTKEGEAIFNVIIFQEDTELITKYTPKEERMRDERKRVEVSKKIYNSLILPTLQGALAEFKLSVNEDGVYLGHYNIDDFIKVAFMKLVLPRCEELGLDIEPLRKRLLETKDKCIHLYPIDFKLNDIFEDVEGNGYYTIRKRKSDGMLAIFDGNGEMVKHTLTDDISSAEKMLEDLSEDFELEDEED